MMLLMMPISVPRLALPTLALAAALACAMPAHADSFASSASSAGSASSGSVSDSLNGSSNSSNGDRRVADGDYRIIDIAQTPRRAGMARVTLRAGDTPDHDVVLDLPQATFDRQQLAQGDMVHARHRVYGIEFARGDTRTPFYLVLEDAWYGELASRPVSL